MIRSRLRRLLEGPPRPEPEPEAAPQPPPPPPPPPPAPYGRPPGAVARPQPAPAPPAPAPPAPPAPAAPAAPSPLAPEPPAAPAGPAEPAADFSGRFAMRILVLAEQQREALDTLERDEQDPDRLQQLYGIDHAVAQMRRAARELRVLAGQDDADMGGRSASLIDVVRMAAASIETYQQIDIGTVADLSVPDYAADDAASLIAPLLDNATRYSPGTVAVSAHVLENGGAVFRISDSGIGLSPERLEAINASLTGEDPAAGRDAGGKTGFAVVRRLARRHGAKVHLSGRSAPGGGATGTTVSVSLPPHLVDEAADREPVLGERLTPSRPAPPPGDDAPRPPAPQARPAHLTLAPGPVGDADMPDEPPPPARPPAHELPRRERKSLRAETSSGFRGRRPLAADAGPADGPGAPTPSESFADDLDAFSGGSRPAGDPSSTDPENEVP